MHITMPAGYRRPAAVTKEQFNVVPRLELDVPRKPRHYDVTHRRARTDHDHYRRSRREKDMRGYYTARPSAYGFDMDYQSDYGSVSDYETAPQGRVRMYTHDSHDPYSCTCFPRASSKSIPSMMYDGVRCPHPEHLYQPAKQDYFAYPWTVQTFRPTKPLQFGYHRGQVKPPSAVTAPPFALYTSKVTNPSKGDKGPPYTAPVKQALPPLLSTEPSDRRLRRVDRRRLAVVPNLDTVEEDISPFDSISQVSPLRSFRPESLRLRTVDEPVMRRVESELRVASRNRALSTPRPVPLYDADGFPQTPTRIFKGEYVDPNNGQKYEYDIKYGKMALGGTRRLKTV